MVKFGSRESDCQIVIALAISEAMPARSQILISCLREEAHEIRERAALDQRSVSSYLLKVLMRWVEFEEKLFLELSRFRHSNRVLMSRRLLLPHGPRTTILLRCSNEDSHRIRRAAQRRAVTISGFIRQCLRRSWSAADERLKRSRFDELTVQFQPVPPAPQKPSAPGGRRKASRSRK